MGENQTKGKRGNNVHEKEALEITPRNALGVHDNPLGLGITKRDIVMKTEKAVRKRKLYCGRGNLSTAHVSGTHPYAVRKLRTISIANKQSAASSIQKMA